MLEKAFDRIDTKLDRALEDLQVTTCNMREAARLLRSIRRPVQSKEEGEGR